MGDKINFNAFHNFSGGKYSFNEYLNVKRWFAGSKADKQTEEMLFAQWQNTPDTIVTEERQKLFQQIHYKILLEEKGLTIKRNWWFHYRQVAAVLVPFFFVAGLAALLLKTTGDYTQAWIEINAPIGARTEFMLPDGTSGWLNNGAKLKYPAVYSKHREVDLVGEAYFHVKHHQNSDFTVRTTDMAIKVLGTKFNVSAYNDDSNTKVVLEEGRVEVTGLASKFQHTLQPGESLTFDHNNNLLTNSRVDPTIYTAWTEGYLVIDDEPLDEAFRKVGRWFNASIEIQGKVKKGLRLKATFKEESLAEVLNVVSMSTPISYKIFSGKNDSSGRSQKTQVIIELKLD